jgi:transposase
VLPRAEGHRAIVMFDVNDDAKGEYRRVEILTGPGRRRRWSAEEKARIVEETLVPGARVSEVADARPWPSMRSMQTIGQQGIARSMPAAHISQERQAAASSPIPLEPAPRSHPW